jgi:hypothetical protein
LPATLSEPAIHAGFRDTTPSPPASAIERLDLICIELRNDVISPAKANVLLKATYQQAELQHKMVVEEHMAKTQRQVEDLKLLVAKLSDDNLTSEDESREDGSQQK